MKAVCRTFGTALVKLFLLLNITATEPPALLRKFYTARSPQAHADTPSQTQLFRPHAHLWVRTSYSIAPCYNSVL